MDASDIKRLTDRPTWEEESGLLDFLSKVHGEVLRFDDAMGFGIEYVATPPSSIDGEKENLVNVGFVLLRRNNMISERYYCLYSLLREKVLYGFIGTYDDGKISTLRELKPIKDFRSGPQALYEWLKELVKVSCDKW